jgi:hypothetical protein
MRANLPRKMRSHLQIAGYMILLFEKQKEYIYCFSFLSRVITHISSAPQLHTNTQIVPSSTPSHEQTHIIELLQREPLPTLSPSK